MNTPTNDGLVALGSKEAAETGFTFIELTEDEMLPLEDGKPNPAYLKNCIHLYTQYEKTDEHLHPALVAKCAAFDFDEDDPLLFMLDLRDVATNMVNGASNFMLMHMDIALEPFKETEEQAAARQEDLQETWGERNG